MKIKPQNKQATLFEKNQFYTIELDDKKNVTDELILSNFTTEDYENTPDNKLKMPELPVSFIIIDCSPINYIDSVGVKTIKQVKFLLFDSILFEFKLISLKIDYFRF